MPAPPSNCSRRPRETSPESAHTLRLILSRLDDLDEKMEKLDKRVSEVESRLYILDERLQSESRIQRMLNTTLIAIGALLGSLLAVFAR